MNIIVAATNNRGIGLNGTIPWKIIQDLKFFRLMTTNNAVIMGRKTYDSIGRPLPNRRNIVITKNPGFRVEEVTVVNDAYKVFFLLGKAIVINIDDQ